MAGTASRELHDTAIALRALPYRSMITVARAVKQIAEQEAARAGSPLAGKRTTRRPVRLRARDEITERGEATYCRVRGSPVGPWVWVTDGTDPHPIRRRKKGPLRKLTIQHPGSAGRGGWRRVRTRAERIIPQIFRDDVHEAVR